ncbi:hypothetical protein E2C01_100253 [Portunus trituberculatus]|uniref:Uncharacterized protein n=1 Tax=Portunus trituberculatus TaxID=210409 RepID=A0A5B7KHH5_PORTR|nr:hypothetical protein [Portunus trituberculatus]
MKQKTEHFTNTTKADNTPPLLSRIVSAEEGVRCPPELLGDASATPPAGSAAGNDYAVYLTI